jgi:hypothetical protein
MSGHLSMVMVVMMAMRLRHRSGDFQPLAAFSYCKESIAS